MKRYFKIFILTLFALVIFGLSKQVQANSISKISMDIYVSDSGNATITEVWNCNANQGTEVYHPYYNLGNSSISNLSVKDGSATYTTLSSWSTSGSLSSKANKCGINKVSNGVELCWGISSYGSHIYTVTYTITNFVSELSDSQMIYWTLIPYDFSSSIGSVYIKINTGFSIADTVDVWGYGNYGGTAYVYNGYIEMQSDGALSTDEYMTILVKFPLGTFTTENKLDYNFNHYYEMAQEGSTAYSSSSSSDFLSGIGTFFGAIFSILLNPAVLFIIIAVVFARKKKDFEFGPEGKAIPKDVAYYRDIPCSGDVLRAYYIGYQYDIVKNKTDILGSIILKWLKESKIRIEQREPTGIFQKENTVIILTDTNIYSIEDEKEQSLFKMLYEASQDGILENKEFERWCNKSYSKILSWFDSIITREKDKLIREGLITMEETKTLGIFKGKAYTATPELKQEAIELAGLKRYLNDYTLISERSPIDVHLFEDYLIFAQMMGIAKKVAKDFKDLYPDVIAESNFTSYDNIIFINMCSSRGISQASAAKTRAESYSGGGGGFSSGGGGGGSFGGGGGGGGFR